MSINPLASTTLVGLKLGGVNKLAGADKALPGAPEETGAPSLRSLVSKLKSLQQIVNRSDADSVATNARPLYKQIVKEFNQLSQYLSDNPEAAKELEGLKNRIANFARGVVGDARAKAVSDDVPAETTITAAPAQAAAPADESANAPASRAARGRLDIVA